MYTSLILIYSFVFYEDFASPNNWVTSEWKTGQMGSFSFENDTLKTVENASFYTISKSFEEFDPNKGFQLSYDVKFNDYTTCSGAYLKVYPTLSSLESVSGGDKETRYSFMFGPDVCGESKVHAIFSYNNLNYELNKKITTTRHTEFKSYKFIKYKKTFEIWINDDKKLNGSFMDFWNFIPPKMIPDPNTSKPLDWVDEPTIPDETKTKPDDWDVVPKEIPDPNAKKPDDWNDDDDGEFEPSTIPNPDYKGEWTQPLIPNPNYIGEWVAPLVENPEYIEDENAGTIGMFGAIGLEVWHFSAGVEFDNIVLKSLEEYKDEL
tara:strand:+ start:7258 stop:8217 length:960 start_codon:yes stop_codon:yes gene_type:complete